MTSQTKLAKALLPLASVAAGMLMLEGCVTHEETLPNEVTTALASAFTRGDVEACTALYRDDAEIVSDEAPVRGKHAIAAFFRNQVARDILFSTDSAVSVVRGDLAVDQGTYRVRNVQRGVDVEHGEYLNVWRLENGRWRVFRSMYNATQAPRAVISVAPEEEMPQAEAASPSSS